MEGAESAEQFALQENQLLCVLLDYSGIVSHLIQAGIITQQDNDQIQGECSDNAGRMQELCSRLVKLNSEEAFEEFRNAVRSLGEVVLAQKLVRDYSSFGIPLNAGDAHPCLFTIDVLSEILSYLAKPDLSTARLVCKPWNAVIAACHMQEFAVRFRRKSGHKQMIDFVSTGPKSIFCKHLTRYQFYTQWIEPGAWIFYKAFFVKFGPSIQTLELADCLSVDLLGFIFSLEIQPYLCNLKHLKMCRVLGKSRIPNSSLNFLSGLETLLLCDYPPQNCMYFLRKVLENDHKLKAIHMRFCSYFVTSLTGFPHASVVLPNLFKTSTLENFTINGLCELDEVALGLMTFPNGGGRLKVIECSIKGVNARVFRDFIASHRHTLRRLSIQFRTDDNPVELLEVLPRLEYLDYLSIGFLFGGFTSNLDFCMRAPNLKNLVIPAVGVEGIPQPVFIHEGLETLRLDFTYKSTTGGVREFMSHVFLCFPNLRKVEVERPTAELDWPTQLGQFELQPESGHDLFVVSVWKRTGQCGKQVNGPTSTSFKTKPN